MIYQNIDKLVSYGLMTGLIKETDKMYVTNRLLEKLGLDAYEPTGAVCGAIEEIDEILKNILDYAVEKGFI